MPETENVVTETPIGVVAVKRGRGRPRTKIVDPNAIVRGRGRPRRTYAVSVLQPSNRYDADEVRETVTAIALKARAELTKVRKGTDGIKYVITGKSTTAMQNVLDGIRDLYKQIRVLGEVEMQDVA